MENREKADSLFGNPLYLDLYNNEVSSQCKLVEVSEGKYYPKERIPAKTQYFIQEVCDELFSKSKDID